MAKLPPFRWARINEEPYEYGIAQGKFGDELVKLEDGSHLRRPLDFDYSLRWGKSEPELILEIIKEIGIHRLANFDGCLCGTFSLRDVDVSISCGKGRERGCWISSRSMDYRDGELADLLKDVGAEIARQVDALHDGRGPMPIHFGAREKVSQSQNVSVANSLRT